MAGGVFLASVLIGGAILAFVFSSGTPASDTTLIASEFDEETVVIAESVPGDILGLPNAIATNAAPFDKADGADAPAKISPPDLAASSEMIPDAAISVRDADGGLTPRLKPDLQRAEPDLGSNLPNPTGNATQMPIETIAATTPAVNQDTSKIAPTGQGGQLVGNPPEPALMTRDQLAFYDEGKVEHWDHEVAAPPRLVSVSLEKGETFVDAMARAQIAIEDRNRAAAALSKHHNLRRLLPGHEFVLTTAEPSQTIFEHVAQKADPENRLLSLEFRPTPDNRIELVRADATSFEGSAHTVEMTTQTKSIKGAIDGSLFLTATQMGAPQPIVAELANIFAYDVDFQREIFQGDEFEAVYEERYDDRGKFVGGGEILFARMNWRGKSRAKGYYRYSKTDDPEHAEYFDETGQSAKRLLMKTPIDGARLSSGFGRRRHPVLGYAKTHKGVDFAAARGTPIYAAGDGVVERANRYGSFGNYVRIRHANGYKTAYAHLNGFASKTKTGRRVRQGDIIGYVGTTGRSTGPHLHYEVHLNGTAVNPQQLKIATGEKLKGDELQRFLERKETIEVLRRVEPVIEEPPLLVSGQEETGAL